MDFLKTALISICALILGIGVSVYLNGATDTSPIGALENVFTSFKQKVGQSLIGQEIQTTAPESSPQEGDPTPGASMSPAELANAQQYFSQLAGTNLGENKENIDPTAAKEGDKKQEEKKAQDEKKSGAEGDVEIKIPSSLFPVPKKRKSLGDSDAGEKGAIYALGTSPYGPPANVKSKIFDLDSILYITNDPNASLEDYVDQNTPYKEPEEPLPLKK